MLQRFTHPTPRFIADSAALADLCQKLQAETFVTVDTEFIRDNTYYPQLCVVQLAGDHDVGVIDAQASGLDLAPLAALLINPAVTKVFHAARQDLEIFLYLFGHVPTPLFDTQIAAMVAGYGDQVGYDALVLSLTKEQIDKAHRFSDWSMRPLSAAQIDYASADVTHLRTVYRKLCKKLEHEGRSGWVTEEMAALENPALYQVDPETIWTKLRPRTNNRRMLGVLRAAVAWREREVQRINIPRQRLVKDECLLEIAATMPRTADDLMRIRGMVRSFTEGYAGGQLLKVIEAARRLPQDALPLPPDKHSPRPSPALVALLKVLLATKSELHDVAQKLIASADDIDRLASEENPDIPPLHGWRLEVFGHDALALKAGKLLLGVAGRHVKLQTVRVGT